VVRTGGGGSLGAGSSGECDSLSSLSEYCASRSMPRRNYHSMRDTVNAMLRLNRDRSYTERNLGAPLYVFRKICCPA
jgi:hypothetical protein